MVSSLRDLRQPSDSCITCRRWCRILVGKSVPYILLKSAMGVRARTGIHADPLADRLFILDVVFIVDLARRFCFDDSLDVTTPPTVTPAIFSTPWRCYYGLRRILEQFEPFPLGNEKPPYACTRDLEARRRPPALQAAQSFASRVRGFDVGPRRSLERRGMPRIRPPARTSLSGDSSRSKHATMLASAAMISPLHVRQTASTPRA